MAKACSNLVKVRRWNINAPHNYSTLYKLSVRTSNAQVSKGTSRVARSNTGGLASTVQFMTFQASSRAHIIHVPLHAVKDAAPVCEKPSLAVRRALCYICRY
jgi:hypothetical protein